MAEKTETKGSKNEATAPVSGDAERAVPNVLWDDSKMTSTYANVCNVSSTREEMTLLFGTNQTWHTGQKDLTVVLTDRIILNPFAAKRLSILLNNVMKEYESRFGVLQVDTPAGATGQ
jgi:hypothetical protein